MGLSRAGFHHDLMVEWDEDAVATVHHNQRRKLRHIRDWPLEKRDVREIAWRGFVGIDLVAGGPPCQPFSIGGKHRGHEDARDMWPEAIRAVREIRPRAFLFENVRGLARAAFADYLRWIVAHLRHPEMARKDGEDHAKHTRRLEACGLPPSYRVLVLQVNAADYGAAQKRHRVIVAGVRADLAVELKPPTPTHSRERLLWDQWVSGEYWRRHGMAVPADSDIPATDRAVPLTSRAVQMLQALPRNLHDERVFPVSQSLVVQAWGHPVQVLQAESAHRKFCGEPFSHQKNSSPCVGEARQKAIRKAWAVG